MTAAVPKNEGVWQMIEADKRRDRRLRRLTVAAWSVTLLVVLIFAGMIGREVMRTIQLEEVGVAPPGAVLDAVMPLVGVVGGLSLLIAVLGTVGVFLRLRTASLHEIQLRLSALEEMLAERGSADRRA